MVFLDDNKKRIEFDIVKQKIDGCKYLIKKLELG